LPQGNVLKFKRDFKTTQRSDQNYPIRLGLEILLNLIKTEINLIWCNLLQNFTAMLSGFYLILILTSSLGLFSLWRFVQASKTEIAKEKVDLKSLGSKNFNVKEAFQPALNDRMELAGEISSMTPSSTSESLSEKEMELFFEKIYSSFFKRDLEKLSSESDFNQIEEYFLNFPYETMETVNNVGGLEFAHFIARLLNCYYYPHYTENILPESLKTRKIDLQDAFTTFNEFIRKYFFECFTPKRPAEPTKRLLELIILILKRLGTLRQSVSTLNPPTEIGPDKRIRIYAPGLKEFDILTKDYIEAWK
jgi:hypothetical protein